jgi:hypothetical protein
MQELSGEGETPLGLTDAETCLGKVQRVLYQPSHPLWFLANP